MDADVSSFLERYSQYVNVDVDRNRVKCLVTGHEMVLSVAQLKKHFEGRKFKAKFQKWQKDYNFDQYAPHIIPDRHDAKNFLYCRLTKSRLGRTASEVEAHVKGRRYIAALKRAEEENEMDMDDDDGGEGEREEEFPFFVGEEKMELDNEEEEEEDGRDNEEEEDDDGNDGSEGEYEDEGYEGGSRVLVMEEEDAPVFRSTGKKRRRKGR